MIPNRDVEDMEDYERSIGDRSYLGTLILIGVILGIGVVAGCIYLLTGSWA